MVDISKDSRIMYFLISFSLLSGGSALSTAVSLHTDFLCVFTSSFAKNHTATKVAALV